MAEQILHADFISVDPTVAPEALEAAIEEARGLTGIESVVSAALIESEAEDADFDMAFLFVLRDFAALEPFGTNERYSRFLQGRIAPVLKGLAGADVLLEGEFPAPGERGACLALAAPPQTYDWEVRSALAAWTDRLDRETSVIGLAVGERQRYRGLAVSFGSVAPSPSSQTESRLGANLISGRARQL